MDTTPNPWRGPPQSVPSQPEFQDRPAAQRARAADPVQFVVLTFVSMGLAALLAFKGLPSQSAPKTVSETMPEAALSLPGIPPSARTSLDLERPDMDIPSPSPLVDLSERKAARPPAAEPAIKKTAVFSKPRRPSPRPKMRKIGSFGSSGGTFLGRLAAKLGGGVPQATTNCNNCPNKSPSEFLGKSVGSAPSFWGTDPRSGLGFGYQRSPEAFSSAGSLGNTPSAWQQCLENGLPVGKKP